MTQWFVWSSGLEQWDPIEPIEDVAWVFGWIRWSHDKSVAGKRLRVYVDTTGRYVGAFET